jgi:SAM-dependent methyltransferase
MKPQPPLDEHSPFFLDRREFLQRHARLGPVVDLACGRGRHSVAAGEFGLPVIGVDRNRDFLRELQTHARERQLAVKTIRADLESGFPPPLQSDSCGVVLVFRFLFRPLAPMIEELLAPGGLLLYETFTRDHEEQRGKGPRNPAYWLDPGELDQLFPRLETLFYEECKEPAVARLMARRRA